MLSNSKGQNLIEHSFAVGILSRKLFNHLFPEHSFNHLLNKYDVDQNRVFDYSLLSNIIANIGFYHDLGKLDPNFQSFINSTKSSLESYDVQIDKIENKKDFDINNYPLHQEISWSLTNVMIPTASRDYKPYHADLINYCIYWHHAKLVRNNKMMFSKASDIIQCPDLNAAELLKEVKDFNVKLNELIKNKSPEITPYLYVDEDESVSDFFDKSKNSSVPVFQTSDFLGKKDSEKDEFLKNALRYLFRSIIVSADRVILELSAEMLQELVEDNDLEALIESHFSKEEYLNISEGINGMLDAFNVSYPNSERSVQQEKTAEMLSEINDIAVLSGPAGVGKTKIMLDWVNRKNKKSKVFIVTPKTSICYSLYQEIRKEYLPNNTVEIVTGDFKQRSQKGSVVELNEDDVFNSEFNITTIDQLLTLMMSHKKIDVFLEVLNSTLIFDEFHEFLDTPGIVMLFIQLILLKRMSVNNDCLLVSATPNPYLLKNKLYLKKENIVRIDSFNNTQYTIKLENFIDKRSSYEIDNDMFHAKQEGQILLFNSATKSQVSAINSIRESEKNTLNYHSKLFSKDKKRVFDKIMSEFGKKNRTKRNILRVGPILQASVDISTHSMLTEISSIDNIYQRLGRVVRWAENDTGEYVIYTPSNFEDKTGSIRKGLEGVGAYNTTKAFAEYIEEKLKEKSMWLLNELYPVYEEFFTLKSTKEAYDQDWLVIVENSKKVFDQAFEPLKFLSIRKTKKESKVMAKKSLRGRSLFAIGCTLSFNKGNSEIIEPGADFSDNLFTIDNGSFYGLENKNNILEEVREQIEKNAKSSPYLNTLKANIKDKSYAAKKKISSIPVFMFLDFARNEDTPLVLSFKGVKHKMKDDEERLNIIYEGVTVGLMNYSIFNKVK